MKPKKKKKPPNVHRSALKCARKLLGSGSNTKMCRDIAAVIDQECEVSALQHLVGCLDDTIEDHERVAGERFEADRQAIKLWEEATGCASKWPKHVDLCIWLLERIRAMTPKLPEKS